MSRERPVASDLRARVLAEIAQTPSPTRAIHQRRAFWVTAVGVVATALLFVVGGVTPGGRPVAFIAFTAGSGLALAALLTWLLGMPRGSMLGRPRGLLMGVVLVTAPALALMALGATLLWPAATVTEGTGDTHVGCAAICVAEGLVPLLAFLVPRRGSDPIHPAITGAALGMTAGAWTVMMAYLRCPFASLMHCVGSHVLPSLLLAAIGACLGWAFLRVRGTPYVRATSDSGGARARGD